MKRPTLRWTLGRPGLTAATWGAVALAIVIPIAGLAAAESRLRVERAALTEADLAGAFFTLTTVAIGNARVAVAKVAPEAGCDALMDREVADVDWVAIYGPSGPPVCRSARAPSLDPAGEAGIAALGTPFASTATGGARLAAVPSAFGQPELALILPLRSSDGGTRSALIALDPAYLSTVLQSFASGGATLEIMDGDTVLAGPLVRSDSGPTRFLPLAGSIGLRVGTPSPAGLPIVPFSIAALVLAVVLALVGLRSAARRRQRIAVLASDGPPAGPVGMSEIEGMVAAMRIELVAARDTGAARTGVVRHSDDLSDAVMGPLLASELAVGMVGADGRLLMGNAAWRDGLGVGPDERVADPLLLRLARWLRTESSSPTWAGLTGVTRPDGRVADAVVVACSARESGTVVFFIGSLEGTPVNLRRPEMFAVEILEASGADLLVASSVIAGVVDEPRISRTVARDLSTALRLIESAVETWGEVEMVLGHPPQRRSVDLRDVLAEAGRRAGERIGEDTLEIDPDLFPVMVVVDLERTVTALAGVIRALGSGGSVRLGASERAQSVEIRLVGRVRIETPARLTAAVELLAAALAPDGTVERERTAEGVTLRIGLPTAARLTSGTREHEAVGQ